MSARPRFDLELLEGRITPVSFGSPYGYDAGFNATAVALGDVDNDGDLDLAAGAFVGGISLKLNNGAGVFTDSANAAIGDPRSIALVDMDGDNKRDLVVANGGGFQVVIVRGNGNGTFANTITKNIPGGALSAIVADLNEDGRPDVAVASGGRVYVTLNDGTAGILGSPAEYITGTDTFGGTVGDFNDDGKLDLAFSGYSTDRFDVLLNTGNGTFGPKTSYSLPWHGGGVAAGDLNNDGRDDLAITLRDSPGLLIYISNANGTLQSPTMYTPSTGNADGAALVDVDLDGNLDVISRSFGISRAIIWTGNGDGTIDPPILAHTALNASDLTVGDVNGDTLPDLATTATTSPGSVAITPNTTTGVNPPPVITSNGGGATATVNVAENATAVTTVTATDASVPAQTLTYSISGGADATKFAINGSTGVLTFVTAPNFEAPTDAGANNVYDVTVRVSDGAGGTDNQAIAVTVTNVNEQAVIGGISTGSVTEDGTLTTSNSLTVTDPDAGQSVFEAPPSLAGTYGTFTFNPTTGAWGYTLNNGLPIVQALNAGQTLTDTLTVMSLDGTATRALTVTINGAAEPVVASAVPQLPLPPYYTNAVVFGNLLVLQGNGVPGGTAIIPVSSGSFAMFTDMNGDGKGDVVLFLPGLVLLIDGQTGRFLAFAADTNGDSFMDVLLFNSDGTTTTIDGRTGRRN